VHAGVEDHRPLYNWFNERLAESWTGPDDVRQPGLLQLPLPQQIEFARLNLTYVVPPKRKLIQLVEEHHVDGWDDPRMPTLVGARRRGYTPEGFRTLAERIGVAKAPQLIEFSELEDRMREHLNEIAVRRMAVLDPLKLVIENYPEGSEEMCEVPNHPQKPDGASAKFRSRASCGSSATISRRRRRKATSGYSRQSRAAALRLRRRVHRLRQGHRHGALPVRRRDEVGYAGRKQGQGEGQHPLGQRQARVPGGGKALRPPVPGAESVRRRRPQSHSKKVITAQLEPALRDAKPEERFQFERKGYFVADGVDSRPARRNSIGQ
jgi:glutaminyl-tRNA synthetase